TSSGRPEPAEGRGNRVPGGASTSTETSIESQSWTSCGVFWKCHLIVPVFTSSATMESLYRLSPSRPCPVHCGFGCPVPKYTRPSSGSYEPLSQIGAPWGVAPPHVLYAGSLAFGRADQVHKCFPVSASSA